MKAHNLKNGKRIVVTHGELVMKPIESLPKGLKISEFKSYIASHSESGHNHMLTPTKGKIKVAEHNGKRYAIIEELTRLWHDKSYEIHEEVILAPGIYEMGAKTEYNPFTKVIQRVFD